MAGNRHSDGAGAGDAEVRGGADDVVAFGLSVEFVDHQPERGTSTFERFPAEAFACGAYGPEGNLGLPVQRYVTHAPHGRRGQEEVADAGLGDEAEGCLGIEFFERTEDDRERRMRARAGGS